MTEVHCTFCGTEIDTSGDAYYRAVSGWERPRGRTGGANQITLRHPEDIFACVPCIRERIQGVLTGQQALVVVEGSWNGSK